jgi:hypothetical protein
VRDLNAGLHMPVHNKAGSQAALVPQIMRLDHTTGVPQWPTETAEESYAHARVTVEDGRKVVATMRLAESPEFFVALMVSRVVEGGSVHH